MTQTLQGPPAKWSAPTLPPSSNAKLPPAHLSQPFKAPPAKKDTASMCWTPDGTANMKGTPVLLKAAPESVYEVQQVHAAEVLHNSRRGDEQVLRDRRLSGDMAFITANVAESPGPIARSPGRLAPS